MKNIVTRLILPILAVMMLMIGQTGTVAAACPPATNNNAKGQVLEGVGQAGSNCRDDGVEKLIATIVRLLSFFIGVVAVIMIMVSGFKYITANGDSAKVGNAKETLIYALIGLVIAALAQVIVRWLLSSVKA